jgi:MoaA/NifB/PqqE/SkfB family radical SAM enzyme
MRNVPTIARAVTSTLRSFGRNRPLFTHLTPTHACNLRCTYCYQSTTDDRAMSPTAFVRVIRALHGLGLTTVAFTGGEPLLWPHLTHAVRFCSHMRLFTQVTTNGVLLTPAVVRRLARAGLDYLMLSLDAVHRQPFTRKTVADNPSVLESLRVAANLGMLVSINAVLTRRNVDQVFMLANLCRQTKWPLSIGLMLPPPLAPALHDSDLAFSPERDGDCVAEIVERLTALKHDGCPLIEPIEYYRGIPRYLAGERVWDCAVARRNSIQVGPDGLLYWCAKINQSSGIAAATLTSESHARFVDSSATVLERCNPHCYSNCAFTGSFLRAHPVRSILTHLRLFAWPALCRRLLGRTLSRATLEHLCHTLTGNSELNLTRN